MRRGLPNPSDEQWRRGEQHFFRQQQQHFLQQQFEQQLLQRDSYDFQSPRLHEACRSIFISSCDQRLSAVYSNTGEERVAVCLDVCLSVCLDVCLSVHLPVCLSVSDFFHLPHQAVFVSRSASICLSKGRPDKSCNVLIMEKSVRTL